MVLLNQINEYNYRRLLKNKSSLSRMEETGKDTLATVSILFIPNLGFCSFFLQMLDYETKKSYTFKVEVSNALADPRFLHLGPFKDSATVKVNVLDVDEPPVFTKPSYFLDVYEDTPPGTIIGSVTAHDLDASSSAVR